MSPRRPPRWAKAEVIDFEPSAEFRMPDVMGLEVERPALTLPTPPTPDVWVCPEVDGRVSPISHLLRAAKAACGADLGLWPLHHEGEAPTRCQRCQKREVP